MNYFTVFTDLLLRPSEFFKKMPREDNLFHALIFSIVSLIITALIGHFFGTVYVSRYLAIPGTIFIKETFALFIDHLVFTAGSIVSFALFGARGRYKDSFIILAYSTAVLPLEFLPVFPIDVIMSIYWVHICIRGGQFVYDLSYWKSCQIVLLGITVIPFLLIILTVELIFDLFNPKIIEFLAVLFL